MYARSFRVLHDGRNSGRLPLASRALVKALPVRQMVKALPVRPLRATRPLDEMQPVYVWPSVVLPRPAFTVGSAEIEAAYALYQLKHNDDDHAQHGPNYAHRAHDAAATAAGNR